jgi:hypothetical protein
MDTGYIKIYEAKGQLDAETVKIFLESEEIPVVLSGESVGQVYGLTFGSLGRVDVLVPADKVEQAQELISKMENGDLDTGEDFSDLTESDTGS